MLPPQQKAWHLASITIPIRLAQQKRRPPAGRAQACVGLLTLQKITAEFHHLDMALAGKIRA
jgi:hypothetical protein